MGKADVVWIVPVAEVQELTPTIFEKRFKYYGVSFPSLCCVCGEAPGTVAHEIKAMPGLGKKTFTMNIPWCQRCAEGYATIEKEWEEKEIKPIKGKWLRIAFVFGIVWWLAFGFIEPGILPAIGGTIWMGSIAIYIGEWYLAYILYRRKCQNYENAIKIIGARTKGIIDREKVLLVSFKNEKYSEAFGKANPHAKCMKWIQNIT